MDYLEGSLIVKLRLLAESHMDVADLYDNTGHVCRADGDYDKALECLTKSLSIRPNKLHENHLDMAPSYNNIGSMYQTNGDNDKALE